MPPTIIATVGGSTSNSYATVDEADDYFDSRVPLSPAWDTNANQEQYLIAATRILDGMFRGVVTYMPPDGNREGYTLTGPKWTGLPASASQRLAWPRSGMYDQNGNLISTSVIPQEIKDAQCELAGQLFKSDRTLDNDIAVQGITSVRAGSVSLTFKERGILTTKMIPDAVFMLLVPSWFVTAVEESVLASAEFEVL